MKNRTIKNLISILAGLIVSLILVSFVSKPSIKNHFISPLSQSMDTLQSLKESKSNHEVYGYAPWWTINQSQNIDFNVLTTLSYFDIKVAADGNLIQDDDGYRTFKSKDATALFQKAHDHGTRVVLTISQMNGNDIETLMDDPAAQARTIDQTVDLVKKRGIDGISVDFEYGGDPGEDYRRKFTQFVTQITNRMHDEVPGSKVSVAVYASAIKEPKIYDINALAKNTDAIFMMAYDFATAGSDYAMPTAPLYGYNKGKGPYWYDVSTAVNDFLAYMPPEKLILGVPYYGYNYVVYQPGIKAETLPYYSWKGQPTAQTYSVVKENINASMEGVDKYYEGWDDVGKTSYRAYHIASTNTWRMVFYDDSKSLKLKYDFAKDKNLLGVGMWAVGNDNNTGELWDLLAKEYGNKLADARVIYKLINENI